MKNSFIQNAGKPWVRNDPEGAALLGLGHEDLLDQALVAFFASRQCSGVAIRLGMDWALAQARTRRPVISGFHSPLEQSVLRVLLHAKSPVVAVLARPVSQAKLPPEWHTALNQGCMAVVSRALSERQPGGAGPIRLTAALASERNDLVAGLAERIIVAHVSPDGALARACKAWEAQGIRMDRLT